MMNTSLRMLESMENKINALKVNQWLDVWDDYEYKTEERRKKPDGHFYLFSMSAPKLKALSGIFRRTEEEKKKGFNENIQRGHDEERSETINKFIRHGYPYSDLSNRKIESGNYEHLKKPGWLPTAIIINILKGEDKRKGVLEVQNNDLITVNSNGDNQVEIVLPESFDGSLTWNPEQLHPIEVIDGQHRLWAFENDSEAAEFELPVVAFHGLDISWQAYLFWSINITPKKINPSLAYDLYPLLRSADWLDEQDNYIVYRETRAQELVEGLWGYEDSPWFHRINMLGERGQDTVSQSAYIKSIVAALLRSKRGLTGGLFAAEIEDSGDILSWDGAQQVAYLIFVWSQLKTTLIKANHEWIKHLQAQLENSEQQESSETQFSGKYSLLKTDQGVRGILYIINDFSFLLASKLKLDTLFTDVTSSSKATDHEAVASACETFEKNKDVADFISKLSTSLAEFDWRTFGTPGLQGELQTKKAGYKGSGGYKMLRLDILDHLKAHEGDIGRIATKLRSELG